MCGPFIRLEENVWLLHLHSCGTWPYLVW